MSPRPPGTASPVGTASPEGSTPPVRTAGHARLTHRPNLLAAVVVATCLTVTAGTAVTGAAAATPSRDIRSVVTTADDVGGAQLSQRGVVVAPGPGADPLPEIRAKAWLLADADTGEVLAAKNAHAVLPPASTLKTLTALTVLPRLEPDDVYRARPSDVAADGGHVGIVAGATYTVEDLLNGMLLASGNDAADAVAHANGGLAATVSQMNDEALRLQANDTVARNPSGLDADGQVSTPYDLALIARAGLAREDFRAYVSRVSADFPGYMPKKPGKKRQTFKIYTQNRLLLNGFPGAIGVKTGYTTNAGRTFVGAAERDGRTLIVALMRITDWTETAASNALDWGFANAGAVTPVGTLVDPLNEAAFAAALAARDEGAATGETGGSGEQGDAGEIPAGDGDAAGGAPAGAGPEGAAAAPAGDPATADDPMDRPSAGVIAALLGVALLGLAAMVAGVIRSRGTGIRSAPGGGAAESDPGTGGGPAGRGRTSSGRRAPSGGRHAAGGVRDAAPDQQRVGLPG